MTEKWIIKNGEIMDTTTNMTFDSFMEIIIILNGQSRHLNKMTKENKKLKSICQDHRDHANDFKADCVRLEKENEELKNIIVFAHTLLSKNTIDDEEYSEFYELYKKVIKQ